MENSNYVGKRLDGRYEIMEVIGVGGMAVVYKAYDNLEQRTVAVKILKDEYLANEEFKRRFKNESKAIAVLSHNNIVRVFDVSYGDMLQYIVMEHVEGITLKEYVQQQGKIDIREAIYFISQILRALQHAHDKGIVHRDVKPQNIMLQEDGTIKVTDFGIARFSRSETRTMTDGAIGSVHYISPEQAKGNITDAKTDLYAAGVILYEMLTGSLPFQSDNAVSVALMQLQKEPVMPRELNPDIPVGLEQIIMKAMQKNVVDRYQTASEMLFDINKYKENPNIKFNYSVASTGAEKIETIEAATPANQGVPMQRPSRPKNPQRPEQRTPVVKEEPVDETPEIDAETKKKTIMILSGVLVALIIFAAVLLMVFGSNDKNTIEVPKLEGLNYYTDIVNNEAYNNFNIVPNFRPESTETAGKVLEQDPKEGKKVNYGAQINIYIAGSSNNIEIPATIIGKNFNAAETELKALGFVVSIVKEKNKTLSVGSVIRSDPKAGEKVAQGSVVTLYVASDADPVVVPDLIGLTISQATAALEKVGLKLDLNSSEFRNSTVKYGIVIGYDKVGETVLPGTSIAIYVSNGQAGTTTEEDTTDASTTSTTATSTTETTTEVDDDEEDYTYYTDPSDSDEDEPYVPTEEVSVTIYIPTFEDTDVEDTTYPETEETEPVEEEEPSDEETPLEAE